MDISSSETFIQPKWVKHLKTCLKLQYSPLSPTQNLPLCTSKHLFIPLHTCTCPYVPLFALCALHTQCALHDPIYLYALPHASKCPMHPYMILHALCVRVDRGYVGACRGMQGHLGCIGCVEAHKACMTHETHSGTQGYVEYIGACRGTHEDRGM